MKKWHLWKRMKLMSNDDKKQLLIILTLRLVIIVIFCLLFVKFKNSMSFDYGFIFGIVLAFITIDFIEVWNNFIKYTDKLFNQLKIKKENK